MRYLFAAALYGLFLLGASSAQARDTREVGAVSTAFQLVGPNHKIVVTAFEDPKIKGITCYVARPKTGGVKGGLGLAEDPSLGSVSCVQTGPISFTGKIDADEAGEDVFDEKRSLVFKSLKVNRLYDKETGTFVYVVRTKRIIEGSPTTSVCAVTPMTWDGIAPAKPELK
ncbi:MAG: CreA family protein [Alphaproteobacteria bacterium]